MTMNPFENIGKEVEGTYYGNSFSGILRDVRPITTSPALELTVKLKNKIVVFGHERDEVCLWWWENPAKRNFKFDMEQSSIKLV